MPEQGSLVTLTQVLVLLHFDKLFLSIVTFSHFSEHLPDWQAGWMRLRGLADVWYFLLALSFSMWPYALFNMASLKLLRQNLSLSYGLFHDALGAQASFQTIWCSQDCGEVLRFFLCNVSWTSFIFLVKCFEIVLLSGVTWPESILAESWPSHSPFPGLVNRVILLGRGSEVVVQSNCEKPIGQK